MRTRSLILNFSLIVLSILVGLVFAEGVLRFLRPHSAFRAANELEWMRKNDNDLTKVFTVDPAFGFRPILGNSIYNAYGTQVNAYNVQKRPGITRLLFIGDSVTQRARIVNALKLVYGETEYEYWNAGVEAFNTVQEVKFYRRFNAGIRPDHVILTFHLNDFETTPIAFFDGSSLVVYAPHLPSRFILPWLFEYSYVYRLILGITTARRDPDRSEVAGEIRRSLLDLKHQLASDGIELTVLVLPLLKPPAKWTSAEAMARKRIIEILTGASIRHFDLLEVLNDALERGVVVQETAGDTWHPNDAISALFAAYLKARGLL